MKLLFAIILLAETITLGQTSQPTTQPTSQPTNIKSTISDDDLPQAMRECKEANSGKIEFFGLGPNKKTRNLQITKIDIELKNIDMSAVRKKIIAEAKAELDKKIAVVDEKQALLLKEIKNLQYQKQQLQRPTKKERVAYYEKKKEFDAKITEVRKKRTASKNELAELKKLVPGKNYFKSLYSCGNGMVGQTPEKYLKVIRVIDNSTALCERIEGYAVGPSKNHEPIKVPVLIKIDTSALKPDQKIDASMPFIKIGYFNCKDGDYETSRNILQPVDMYEHAAK